MWRKSAQEARIFLWITTFSIPMKCHWNVATIMKMKVVPHDLNVWLSRMYLGDADGFSIMYYSDVDSIVYWANEAAYTYGVSGIAIWSLGQEDMRLWDSMPDQI